MNYNNQGFRIYIQLCFLFAFMFFTQLHLVHAEPRVDDKGDHSGSGNAGGEARLSFQIIANNFYNYVQTIPTEERRQILGEKTLQELRTTIDNMNLIEVETLEPDEVGNAFPIAKNFTYPDKTDTPGGLIKINSRKFLKSKKKMSHVCHEVLGLMRIEDRSYEKCYYVSHMVNKFMQIEKTYELDDCKLTSYNKVSLASLTYTDKSKEQGQWSTVDFVSESSNITIPFADKEFFSFSRMDGGTNLLESETYFLPYNSDADGIVHLFFRINLYTPMNEIQKTEVVVFPVKVNYDTSIQFAEYSDDDILLRFKLERTQACVINEEHYPEVSNKLFMVESKLDQIIMPTELFVSETQFLNYLLDLNSKLALIKFDLEQLKYGERYKLVKNKFIQVVKKSQNLKFSRIVKDNGVFSEVYTTPPIGLFDELLNF